MADAEAMDVAEEKGTSQTPDSADATEAAEPVPSVVPLYKRLIANVLLLSKAVEASNVQLVERTLRYTTQLRKKAYRQLLKKALTTCVSSNDSLYESFTKAVDSLPEDPAGEAPDDAFRLNPSEKPALETAKELPEVTVYLYNLVLSVMLRERQFADAAAGGNLLVEYLQRWNRRSLDVLGSKVYQNYSFAHEKAGSYADIRLVLLRAHRTACLQHNEIGRAVLLNLLLRNYLAFNAVDHAYKLVDKSDFPESVSNNQLCRYLYYLGRMQTVQLDYSDAHLRLQQALRKAPTTTASGFKLQTQKLQILVQLLMGDIPERKIFLQKGTREQLASYYRLTQAVREGEIQRFYKVLAEEATNFRRDGNYVIAQRLAHNVIKIGLRRISVSYSRIHLDDIAKILSLGSTRAAEHVVAKAIRDGVIDAVIDHDTRSMISNERLNVYDTEEPQVAFHRRIVFCLDLHNEAVRSMQYPADAYKSKQQKRKDEEVDEEELAKELAEAEMDE